jgi:ubiquinone biosynthesis protein UbiJ
MATQSPFSWLAGAADTLRAQLPADFPQSFTPPAWAVAEVQQRVVLLLNHVLMQEPVARERLQRQKGRQVQVCWRDQVFQCGFTPAGLVEFVSSDVNGKAADLVLHVNEPSPLALAQSVLQGNKPPIHIEGDVQLAAEVNWLFDHVRWDPEEDVARLIGDAPAHTLVQIAKRFVEALRSFVQKQTAKAAP